MSLAAGLFTGACGNSSLPTDYDSLVKDYDEALAHRAEPIARLSNTIDSITKVGAKTTDDSIRNLSLLAQTYSHLSLDSAVANYDRLALIGRRAGNDSVAMSATIEKSLILMRQGRDSESLIDFNSVNPDSLPAGLLERYHYVGQQISVIHFDSSVDSAAADFFKEMGVHHAQELLNIVPDSTAIFDFVQATHFKLLKKDPKQVSHLLSVIVSDTASEEMKGIAAFWLAIYYLRTEGPKSPQAGNYLLLAATSELRIGKKSGLAMPLLGAWFYNIGDDSRSVEAWSVAIDNAVESSASNRWFEERQPARIAFEQAESHRRNYRNTIIALIIILVVIIFVAFAAWRSHTRQLEIIEELKRKMVDLAKGRRECAARFLEVLHRYIEEIEMQNGLISRKIAAGKTDELMRVLKSGKYIADQNRVLLTGFDNVFLSIYPTFVADLNALLLPDKAFEQPDAGTLTTELRIMAFSRLGIDDGARVARFLGVSVNTVYAYRNKVRQRVINRETFDDDLMQIGEKA